MESFNYLVLDGTYFHKDGCLMTLMDAVENQIIPSTLYAPKEGFQSTYRWLSGLAKRGLDPLAFTVDGERSTLKVIARIWPHAKIQRCLFHLQHEGCRWLRTYPKTTAGQVLRHLLLSLTRIRSVKERNVFLSAYKSWVKRYRSFVVSLPMNIKANLDLKRTMGLIDRALPNMFHYLFTPQIHSTTNALEGWNSRIKRAYRQHAGLTQKHKIQFLKWFTYFESNKKSNNL
jgi:transposase-like protein